MPNKIQYLVAYPDLARFGNTYSRTSKKGRKHLVRKNRRKKILIATATGLGVLGTITFAIARRGKGKVLPKQTQKIFNPQSTIKNMNSKDFMEDIVNKSKGKRGFIPPSKDKFAKELNQVWEVASKERWCLYR